MIHTQNIYSLTDFQRNASGHIERLKDSGFPEVLTVKDLAELAVQTADAYQALLDRLELFESAAAITRRMQDAAAGRSSTLEDFDARMRSKYPTGKKRI